MPRTRGVAAAPAAALVLLAVAAARLPAQSLIEWQIQGLGTWANSSFAGGGVGVAWRAAGRERVALSLTAGSRDGTLAGRGELLAAYYLNPSKRQGVTPYGAAGIAVQGVQGGGSLQGDVVLVLGVESHPGGSSGWFLEGGVGGGFRVALGLRWRVRRSP